MRIPVFLLFLVFTMCSIQLVPAMPATPIAINSAKSVCCEGITHKVIPLKQIMSYQWTTSTCPIKAIVFKTIAGREICVDPQNTLVKKHIANLDKRTSSTTALSPESTFTTAETPASTSATASSSESTSAKSSPASTSATALSHEYTSASTVTFTTAESHSTSV
uniref:chemokine CCL-CUj precursor n=1 Tax=Danio rerio TaxID=7955 RepID=UPI004044E0F8